MKRLYDRQQFILSTQPMSHGFTYFENGQNKGSNMIQHLDNMLIDSNEKFEICLDALDVSPWPEKGFVVLCNLCSFQVCGSDNKQFIALATGAKEGNNCGKGHYANVNVPVQGGLYNFIEVKLQFIDGTPVPADHSSAMITLLKKK